LEAEDPGRLVERNHVLAEAQSRRKDEFEARNNIME
jgi:hypothetical protein